MPARKEVLAVGRGYDLMRKDEETIKRHERKTWYARHGLKNPVLTEDQAKFIRQHFIIAEVKSCERT
jgi:hypothetical protein